MGYSAEVVQRARARLAQAKEDRESENRQHLAEAYAKVPRIREIDMLLRRTMAQAAQAAFLQGSDGQALLEQARRENLSLQQERAALAAANFEDGFLDESPICDKCGGSGYVGTTMCECLSELCRQEQKKEICVLSNSRETFSQFRLDYYPDAVDPKYGASPRTIMERTLNICRRYAATFTPNAGNLLFIGGKMVWDTLHEDGKEEEEFANERLDLKELLLMAVATSIDALAMGITFAFLSVSIGKASGLIGCTTFVISALGVFIGNRFGAKYKDKASLTGGIILILIGCKVLLEHLGILG